MGSNWNPILEERVGDAEPVRERSPSFAIEDAPAPLFRDPIFDGAADPSMAWNHETEEWWILYTQRRANVDVPGKGWIHGSDIGVATSDGGRRFLYRGTLELDVERGHNTYWAPEILHHEGTYHLFMSYLRGVPQTWEGNRYVVHFTSPDLWNWEFEGRLSLTTEYVIDPDVHRLPDGTWRMWYKDEANESHIYTADSDDLFEWTASEVPVLDDKAQEAPIVFEWRDRFWQLTDSWDGLSVYRSPDGEEWEAQPDGLLTGEGQRPCDDFQGGHPDVFVVGDRAYILYHVHQPAAGQRYETGMGKARQTVLQVAELEVEDGWLVCDRDRYHNRSPDE